MLRNPFLGSMFYQVPGHHFVDLAYLFMNMQERFPSERDRQTSTEFARRWIAFSYQKSPWTEYRDQQSIAVVDSQSGWRILTKKDDILLSREAEDGGRRYEQWEILFTTMEKLYARGVHATDCFHIENVMKLA